MDASTAEDVSAVDSEEKCTEEEPKKKKDKEPEETPAKKQGRKTRRGKNVNPEIEPTEDAVETEADNFQDSMTEEGNGQEEVEEEEFVSSIRGARSKSKKGKGLSMHR